MSSGFPNSPRLVKGGIVTMDPDTSVVQSVIALQYNPDSLSRTLQIQAMPGGQDGVRVDALRLRGPAVETIKLEAELDATDQLEFPKQFPSAVQYGLHPQLAQLEMLVNPTRRDAAGRRCDGQCGHAGDHSAGAAAHAVCLEQEPRGAGAAHRILHHRRGLRPATSIRSAPRSAWACAC